MSTKSPTAESCIAQADLLLLIAKMLEPIQDWRDEDRDIGDADIEALAAASGLGELESGEANLRAAVAAWQDADPDAVSAEYARLFDGAAACPCNETIYIRRDKGAILADIAGFYKAFGFKLSDRFREKHDHLVVELQFTALLLILLGRAIQKGMTEEQEITGDALRGFIDDHLGAWLGLFAARLESISTIPLYGQVAGLVERAWESLFAAHELQDPGDEVLPVLQETGTPYECGLCEPSDHPTESINQTPS